MTRALNKMSLKRFKNKTKARFHLEGQAETPHVEQRHRSVASFHTHPLPSLRIVLSDLQYPPLPAETYSRKMSEIEVPSFIQTMLNLLWGTSR